MIPGLQDPLPQVLNPEVTQFVAFDLNCVNIELGIKKTAELVYNLKLI